MKINGYITKENENKQSRYDANWFCLKVSWTKKKIWGLKSILKAKPKISNFKLELKSILLNNIQLCQNQLYASRINFDSSKSESNHTLKMETKQDLFFTIENQRRP